MSTYPGGQPVRCVVAGCAIPGRHAPGCGDGCAGCLPGTAKVGLLCGHHHRRLLRDIAEAPALDHDLSVAHLRSSGGGQRVSGTAEDRLPIVPAVTEARERLAGVLRSWARLVVDERGLHGPREDRLPAVCAWLVGHVDWLAAHPAVDQMIVEVRAAITAAWPCAYPSGRRRVRLGPCGGECPGTLTATVAACDELLPALVACDGCGRAVPSSQWRRLRRELTGVDHDPPLTVPAACGLYGVPETTLRRWVARGMVVDVGVSEVRVLGSSVERVARGLPGVLRDAG